MTAAAGPAPASDPRIRTEALLTLHRQIPNSFAAAAVVTVYMIATAVPYTRLSIVLAWVGVQLLSQVYRAAIYWRFRKVADRPADLPVLARRISEYMLLAGLIWGSTIFLFVHADNPVTLALTLCGLYGISGGSVPGNAYNPPGLYLFVGAIFGLVMAKMVAIGDAPHIALGIASLCFAGIMFAFCRVQHRALSEGFAIRFENAELLEAVRAQKAQAEAANLAKSQFLAAASHDLRQPLYALGLFTGALRAQPLEPEAGRILGSIQKNVATLDSLFEGFLDVSRLDAGVVRPQASPFPASAMFARLEQMFAPQAAEHGLRLRFVGGGLWLDTDALLLERVACNLVANAIRYTRRGGVLVAARRRGDRVALEVWDTGVGIAERDRERIFDEFVQVGNPERDREKGFGLGLAIAQRTALLLGTGIELRSQAGRGSVFRVMVDRAAPAPAAAVEAAPVRELVEGLAVLVVDDEASVREGFSLLLTQWGARIQAAESLAAALALIGGGARFDVVFCDVRLRDGESGLDAIVAIAARQVSAGAPPPALCLVTGDLDPALPALARDRGAALVHKPLAPARLRALINHLAAEQARARAPRELAPAG